jgi:hypothetical protein
MWSSFPSEFADDVDAAINVGKIEPSFWWSHPVLNIQNRNPSRPQSTKAISLVVVTCKQHIHIKVIQLQILIAGIGVDTFILSSTNLIQF